MEKSSDGEAEQFLRLAGRRLRERREARGWSQFELGEQVGLHRTFVGAVERGRRGMNVKLLPAFARVYGIEPSELVPGWDAFVERADSPRHQDARRRLEELLAGVAAGMPPLTPEATAYIASMERQRAARRP